MLLHTHTHTYADTLHTHTHTYADTLTQTDRHAMDIQTHTHTLTKYTHTNISYQYIYNSWKYNESSCEALLGVLIYNKLTFEHHVENLCRKAKNKLHALIRRNLQSHHKAKKNIFIIWMFHSRSTNNHINRIHESALTSVCNGRVSTFAELLQEDN